MNTLFKNLILILALSVTLFAQNKVLVPVERYTVIEKGSETAKYLQWDDSSQKYIPLSIEDFSIATKGYYKEYIALLTQSGTNAPVATVLRNTLGGTVVWSYEQEGYYIGTLVNGFVGNYISPQKGVRYIGNDDNYFSCGIGVSNDQIELLTIDTEFTSINNQLVGFYLHIIVFP